MQRKLIIIFLSLMVLAIVVIISRDFLVSRPDKRPDNPFEFDRVKYKSVDSTLVHYKETKNFKLKMNEPIGIAFANNKLFLLADTNLHIITIEGKELKNIKLPNIPSAITVSDDIIYIAFSNYISRFDINGKLLSSWKPLNKRTFITSLGVKGNMLFAADAGNRSVLRYSTEGSFQISFNGNENEDDPHGFIVPSPYFDLAINADGELWVVNPGKHSLGQYKDSGELRSFWTKDQVGIEGFYGCCNPAHIAILADGSFVTSEKKIARIKIYKPSGEFLCVVAPTEKFTEDGYAPDIAVSPQGDIYALDFDKKMIRLFQHK
jgi:sugar lactone lactonase YvrE